jgi:hypothetical protein
MIDKDSKEAADRFIKKLTDKKFIMSRSQNKSEDYASKKQQRDSEAVAEFTQTEIFKDIMNLR